MEKFRTVIPRILAILLDNILLLPLTIVDQYARGIDLARGQMLVLLFIISVSYSIYFILMHRLFGQTVGKMLMKVKVLDLAESRISLRRAVLRDLPPIFLLAAMFIFTDPLAVVNPDAEPDARLILNNPIALIQTIWAITDLIFFLTTKRHRALHDLIAGTIVIRFDEDQAIEAVDRPEA